MLDLGAGRSGNHRSLEELQRRSLARGRNLNATVRAVLYPTSESQLTSLSSDEPPKSDALHAPANFDVNGFHP